MLKRITITKLERGFLYRGRDYVRYLRPGVHWIAGLGVRVRKERVTDVELALSVEDAEPITNDPDVWDDLAVANVREHERAIVWVDERVRRIALPGRSAFWKVLRDVRLEVVDARELEVKHEALASLLASPDASAAISAYDVPPGATGLLLVNGRLVRELGPGRYAFWNFAEDVRVLVVHEQAQRALVNVEVATRDRVRAALAIGVRFRIVDRARLAEIAWSGYASLEDEIEIVARLLASSMTASELVALRDALGGDVARAIADVAESLGIAIVSVRVEDLHVLGGTRR